MTKCELRELVRKLSIVLGLNFEVFLVKENSNTCISWIDGQYIYLDERWFYNNQNEMEIASIIAYEAFHFWELDAILFGDIPFEKLDLWTEEFEKYDCFAQGTEEFNELNINQTAVIFSELFMEKNFENYSKVLDCFDPNDVKFVESLNLKFE